MDYKKILLEYIESKHKNLNQFCKEYGLSYGGMHRDLNKPELGIKKAKTLEDLIFSKTGDRIFNFHIVPEEFGNDTIKIPVYNNVKLSAGTGEDASPIEEVDDFEFISKSFLTKFRVKSENLAIVQVVGDSMLPMLIATEKVIIDKSHIESIDNKVYAITTKNKLWVKRLRVTPVGEKWESDNPEYRKYDDELNNGSSTVRIIGRVIYSLGRPID
ncbi:MAG: helix-turn-helix transcriptional regulator [Neisseriales bacterium]|nr:MAG: helix-turn-helix transcriptional regulator [Neisseriales bacterium]